MATKEEIINSLETVLVPATRRSIVATNLVREVNVTDGGVHAVLASTGLGQDSQEWIAAKAREAVGRLAGVTDINIEYRAAAAKDLNTVGHVLAVMSGKGGVGKSLVSGLLAVALRRQGHEVGILDADITGPSIPRMFGVSAPVAGNEEAILPVPTKSGIEVMSINLLLPSEDDAVVWRGPLIARTITQFWEEVLWGKLDYLIVDLPPGTADAPLTVMQQLPISGIVIVFTPQELTAMVVRKAVKMAQQMEKPIIGVIENMSYLYVPEIDKKIELFGKSRAEEMARSVGAPLLAQLPIDPNLARLCDEGNIERYDGEVITRLAESISQLMEERHA